MSNGDWGLPSIIKPIEVISETAHNSWSACFILIILTYQNTGMQNSD